jgi:hypothetical protein
MTEQEKKLRQTIQDALIETDFHGLSDRTMSDEMRTYRQGLRDISKQSGFPTDIVWPPVVVIPEPE